MKTHILLDSQIYCDAMAVSSNDATEWPELLKKVSGTPPLSADFVFDLPPNDPKKADRVGILMYQALLLKQDHPDLDFSPIRAVTFTMDVHRTGDEIENAVGHPLPALRNAAARMDVFHVSIGRDQLFIVTEDLAQAALSPSFTLHLTAWERLRTELIRSVAALKLADLTGLDSGIKRFEQLARYTWTEYFCGWYASVEGMETNLSRLRLRQSLEEDPASLTQGLESFRGNHDMVPWVNQAEGAVRGLFEAMGEVLGQLRARDRGLADVDGPLDSLIHAQGLSPTFAALGQCLDDIGATPTEEGFGAIARLAQSVLACYGLHYEADGSIMSTPSEL